MGGSRAFKKSGGLINIGITTRERGKRSGLDTVQVVCRSKSGCKGLKRRDREKEREKERVSEKEKMTSQIANQHGRGER